MDEGRTTQIDHLIGQDGGDDLTLQPVPLHIVGELVQRIGEVVHQHVGKVWVVRHITGHQLIEQGDLGVGQQHCQFGPGQAFSALLEGTHRFAIGKEFHLAVEQALLFEPAHETLMGVKIGHRGALCQRQSQRLLVIMLEHIVGDIVRHRLQ